jgi:parvulin-like peptidyl-prolyl isomerase
MMRFRLLSPVLLLAVVTAASAQVASHAPTAAKAGAGPAKSAPVPQVMDRTVALVNGAPLTDRDLLREMYSIFPYAKQHGGFPKDLEPEIRRGALEMIIFDELVYQEAKRRGVAISPAQLARAEKEFRQQFPSKEVYEQYLQIEAGGSAKVMREKIRRALMIDEVLKAEVDLKAMVTAAEARAYYEKNRKRFEHGETLRIQTISIIPPSNASPEVVKEAGKRAQEAYRQAKATKSYREFGLLAEKLSDDDWRVNMGDRKQVEGDKLPPPLVAAARKMKPGEVSELLQFGPNYTLFRLNEYKPAGTAPFAEVKAEIVAELQKAKTEELRAELHKRLRKNAKVEVL